MVYAFNNDKGKEDLLNFVYPVGSIYMSVNNVSPQTLFGGTWQKIEGRFLIAANNTYTNGTTGGSADATVVSHTHTVNGTALSNGAHTHSGTTERAGTHYHFIGRKQNAASGNNVYVPDASSTSSAIDTSNTGSHTHTFTTGSKGAHTHTVNGTAASTGSSGTGKNMPPYLAVNMWKRTA